MYLSIPSWLRVVQSMIRFFRTSPKPRFDKIHVDKIEEFQETTSTCYC